MRYQSEKPLLVQADLTVLLEVRHRLFAEMQGWLHQVAELVKSPDHLHTYRISRISLWNASAAGIKCADVLEVLDRNGKTDIPPKTAVFIRETMDRYGRVTLRRDGDKILMQIKDGEALRILNSIAGIPLKQVPFEGTTAFEIPGSRRGFVKQELLKRGYPVLDYAGYAEGETLAIGLRNKTKSGKPFELRSYQEQAVNQFIGSSIRGTTGEGSATAGYLPGPSADEGNGVLVLPCGAGKTIIGIAAITKLQCASLILTTNVASVRQWKQELLDKTDIAEELVGEYTGVMKQVRPITIATYQILTHRQSSEEPFQHMSLFEQRQWGLIIYDEVHLLPAPVFRATADIQATRRLGLTATLVREDGREADVFSLIGPKRGDVEWKRLEREGWIADATCSEIRVPLPERYHTVYRQAGARQKHRIAAENPNKLAVAAALLRHHKGASALIIGQYIDQLRQIAAFLQAPLIVGTMPHEEREQWYKRFRKKEIQLLVVSKVGNFAVDLPDASVAIQVSGSFGSRQEEAQRLGRILRPKSDNRAFFYTLISRDTVEQQFSEKRRLFLLEQGYRYVRMEADQAPHFHPTEQLGADLFRAVGTVKDGDTTEADGGGIKLEM